MSPIAFDLPLSNGQLFSLDEFLKGWKPPVRRGRPRRIDPSVVKSFKSTFGTSLAAKTLGISQSSVRRLADGK